MTKLKKVSLYTHIVSLILLLINFSIKIAFELNLAANLLFVFKILFYISAVVLFFLYVKPFKKISLYFSIYVFSPVIIGLSWLFDGIFGAILASIFLFFFMPNDVRFENNEILINQKFGGLFGRCCKYEVIRKKMFLFEEKVSDFDFNRNIYVQKNDIKITDSILKMHLILKDYDILEDHYIAKDTTIYVIMK